MKYFGFFYIVSVLFLGIYCSAACPVGDLDGNCLVGLGDLLVFADSWLDDSNSNANLDGQQNVNIADFAILSQHWEHVGYRLVINEFMADNTATIEDADETGQYPDWIEIYNPDTVPVDIAGMYFTDDLMEPDLWQIPAGMPEQTTIQPGGYLLLWADGEPEQGPLHVDFKLSAGGEEIGFFDARGALVDSVVFGSQATDVSYGRYPNGGPGWQTFDNGTASPGWSNGGQSADAGIIINEIMYHPEHDQEMLEAEPVEREFLELYNSGSSVVNLGGWRFVDGIQYQIPADTLIAANGYLVIAADPTAFTEAYPTVTNMVGGWTGKLTNQDEKITLVNAVGTVIDTVHYFDEGEWAQRELGPLDYYHRGWQWSDAADGGGFSLELTGTSLSNEYGRNWRASQSIGGTPGLANSYTVADLPPLILDVRQSPVIPTSDQAVTVTVRAVDETSAGVAMTLYWRVDASTYNQSVYPTYDASSYTTVTMLDDGAHADGQAGDGVFGAVIPPQADGRVIEFFVEATDAAANKRTWPAPCDMDGVLQQVANCLYQVDDAFDVESLSKSGANPAYYLIMTESERARLADIGDEQSGDNNERYCRAQMNGTFISVRDSKIDCHYGVGYRNRGEGSSGHPPNNFRINFRSDQPYDGITKINCNSKYTYLQVAGSQLYRSAGFRSFATVPVRLFTNGTELALMDTSATYGYYAAFVPYGKEWLNEFVLTDPNVVAGNIYKASSSGHQADFEYHTNTLTYVSDGYSKSNNESENDWSDLSQLTNVLDNMKSAPDYAQQVQNVLNIEQWARSFAMATLIGYNENGLQTCDGDDYCLYRTGDTHLFELLIYDLDTILHVAHEVPPLDRSIFFHANRDGGMPQITRMFQEPEFVQIYYQQLWDLTQTFYMPENFNPLLDQILKGWVPDSMLANMKSMTAQRVEQALMQIPLTFSIQSGLPVVDGYARTTASTAQLSGTANAVTTYAVYVNGTVTDWDPITGTWSISGIALQPGINRIVVETYGTVDDSGPVLEEGTFDIWYDNSSESTISGTLTSDRVLTAAAGPWHITGDIVVPAGITLVIEPATTLFFNDGTGITVNGRLSAVGYPYQRIHMTRLPGSNRWDGITFSSALDDNRLVYCDMLYGDQQGESVDVQHARVTMEHMTWVSTNDNTRILDFTHPSAIIRNCVLPSITGTEPVHGTGLDGDEYLIFEGNTFGSTTGYNDIVDFSGGQRPGPIIQFYNNKWLGGGDDGPDLDGTDAHVEGNFFSNFHQTTPDQDSPSYAVATGDQSQVCVVRNVFVNNDHAVLHKENVYSWTRNNTIVNCNIAAISFGEPFRSTPREPGKGTFLDSNVFWNNAAIFEHYFDDPVLPSSWGPYEYGPTGDVGIYNSLLPDDLPAEWTFLRRHNLDADPLFKDMLSDWSLLSGSPAAGSGSNDQDMGAYVPAGASVSGEPDTVTYQTTAALTVSGPGITHYKYRLVDNGINGPWSQEIALPINADDFPTDPENIYGRIELSGLQDGHSYRVDVVGKNTAGLWQGQPFGLTDFVALGDPDGNSSHTWTVDTSSSILRMNEVLALNTTIEHEGTYPDMIELYYDGPVSMDLGGYRLTDNRNEPEKYVFTPGTIIYPGERFVVYAGPVDGTSGIHTGFSINAGGDDLYLLDPDGIMIDSIVFGRQLPDLSIGRVRYEKQWDLTVPTFGSANEIAGKGDWRTLKINEWICAEQVRYEKDRLELYNPSLYPVDMGGLYLTDNPTAKPDQYRIRPFSYIPGNGFAVFIADGNSDSTHLNFKLNSARGTLSLFDTDLALLDQVAYYQQKTDISQGRMPDGGDEVGVFDMPTFGAANMNVITTVTRHDLVEMDDVWSYEQSGTDLGTAWRMPGYDDASWPTGAALLYVEGSSLPAAKNTALTLGQNTYYFRKQFTFDGNPADVDHLEFTTVIDDSAVIYINGVEALKIRLNDPVTYASNATSVINNATLEVFEVPGTALANGQNTIAVEVHQYNSTSSDIVMGLELDAVSITTTIDDVYSESRNVLDGLRITEIMYHPASDPNSEFIELQNISDVPIDLDGVRLTDGVDFLFPAMILQPGEYTVVVADLTAFQARYGTQINVAGEYAGRLDNSGEQIILRLPDPLDAAILRFAYNDSWYPLTDGSGRSLVMDDPTGSAANWQNQEHWRASSAAGGSPGRDDNAAVIVNEILAHSHDTAPDWIELYNTSSLPINIGGWYLSDNADNLKKYRIAENTTINAYDYLLFYEDTQFGNSSAPGSIDPFALSENGDSVYLSSAQDGVLTGYVIEVSFDASETGVSFGRYEKSDGTTVFVPQSTATPGIVNTDPKVGPVVISEIMYNPPAGGSYPDQDYEYVELTNLSAVPVTLEGYDGELNVTLGWKFTSGIDYVFPLGTTLPANGSLIVAKNPAAFTERYGAVSAVVLGPFTNNTNLSNGGERLELAMPGDTDLSGTRYYIGVDSVMYDDDSPWPALPDGSGQSLGRINDSAYGDDAVNWKSQTPSPGL